MRRWGRRDFIVAGGALIVTACSDSGSSPEVGQEGATSTSTSAPTDATSTGSTGTDAATSTTTASEAGSSLVAQDFVDLPTCSQLRDVTGGPFAVEEQFRRRDITEGYPGHPLRLGIRVVDESCSAIPGADVEIWSADATGDYSAFTDDNGGKDEGAGTTFLRGTQTANDDGIVEFLTIYPGWYPSQGYPCTRSHPSP